MYPEINSLKWLLCVFLELFSCPRVYKTSPVPGAGVQVAMTCISPTSLPTRTEVMDRHRARQAGSQSVAVKTTSRQQSPSHFTRAPSSFLGFIPEHRTTESREPRQGEERAGFPHALDTLTLLTSQPVQVARLRECAPKLR